MFRSKYGAPRNIYDHQIKPNFVLTLIPLKSIMPILAKLDFLDEKIIKDGVSVIKKYKNGAEEILYDQYENRILFDVLVS